MISGAYVLPIMSFRRLQRRLIIYIERRMRRLQMSQGDLLKKSGVGESAWLSYKVAAGLSDQRPEETGTSPSIEKLEALAHAVESWLVVDLVPASSDPGAKLPHAHNPEEDVSEDALAIAEQLDKVPPGERRTKLIGAIEGMIVMALMESGRPPSPDADTGPGRARRSK